MRYDIVTSSFQLLATACLVISGASEERKGRGRVSFITDGLRLIASRASPGPQAASGRVVT